MSKVKRIFLDVDGVIANWSKSICENLKVEYPKNQIFPYQRWLAEVIDVKDIYQYTNTFEFWDKLEKFPWSDGLVNLVDKSGIEWRFLTKPMKAPNCFSGKASWIMKNYPKHWEKLWIATGTKSAICRGEGDLLIDDDVEKNLVEWEERGGISFHWNEMTPDYDGWRRKFYELDAIIRK